VRVQRNETGGKRGTDHDEVLEDEHGLPAGRQRLAAPWYLVARATGLVHLGGQDMPGTDTPSRAAEAIKRLFRFPTRTSRAFDSKVRQSARLGLGDC
jgi:hypothetical protein